MGAVLRQGGSSLGAAFPLAAGRGHYVAACEPVSSQTLKSSWVYCVIVTWELAYSTLFLVSSGYGHKVTLLGARFFGIYK